LSPDQSSKRSKKKNSIITELIVKDNLRRPLVRSYTIFTPFSNLLDSLTEVAI
jgi:hypothetical protein